MRELSRGPVARHMWLATAATLLWSGTASAQQPPAPQNALAETPLDADQSAGDAQDIVVTGSRITQSGASLPTPVTVLGQNLFAQIGATQVSQLVSTLPQFRSDQGPTTVFVGGGGNIIGGNQLNLRGLGATRTLVLVNNLRFPSTTTTETFNTDLIPSSLISRMDVVTGGASAAYGSDAVAGVVNILLDNRLQGVRGTVQYGLSEEGDGENQKYSLAAGGSAFGGRIHVVAGIDYEKRKAVGDCYSRSWCAQEYSTVANATPGANGQPAIIIAPDVHSSQLTPAGLVVSSRLTAAFGGQQISADGRSLLPFTFGQFYAPNSNVMVGGSGHGTNPLATGFALQAPQDRISTYIRAEGDVLDSVQGWADFTYGRVQGSGNFASLRAGNQNAAGTAPAGNANTAAIAIANTNPYLPPALLAQMNTLGLTTVNIGKSADGISLPIPSVKSVQDTYRVAGGLKGDLGAFKWDVGYAHGKTVVDTRAGNSLIQANFLRAVQAVNGTGVNTGRIVCAVNRVTTVDPNCAPLNIFGIGNVSAEALAYVQGVASQHLVNTLDLSNANIQGEPVSLWAGPISLAAGVEFRRTKLDAQNDALSAANAFPVNLASLAGTSRVYEGYLEANVPLLKDSTFGRELSLNGAVRYAHYSLYGPRAPLSATLVGPDSSEFSATTWKVGAIYRPTDWLRFRGTLSRDFRAPNVNELYSLPATFNNVVLDPVTNTSSNVPTQSSGNPDLQPEIARTATAGFSVQPQGALRGLEFSVDYYNIDVRDYIAGIGAQTIVSQCFQGIQTSCALVTRNAANSITLIRNISVNASQLKETGIDFELNYRRSFGEAGTASLRLLATVFTKLDYTIGGSTLDGTCQNGVVTQQAFPSQPCYQITGFINYNIGPVSFGTQVRYIPRGKYNNIYVGPEDDGYNPASANSISTNRVRSAAYVTLNASYKLIDDGRRNVELFGVVNNATNTKPPVAPSNNIGTNPILYDVVGRYYRAGVRFGF